MEKLYNKLFKNTLSIALTVVISVLVIVGVVWAATTIGANINTGGTLTVTSTSTLTGKVTTGGDVVVGDDATVTDVLIVGVSTGTFAVPTSTLTVIGSAHFTGTATSSDAVWIGRAGTADYIDLGLGDLYVQDDVEIDSDLTVGGNATTSGYLVVGTTQPTFPMGAGHLLIGNAATSTKYLWVGNAGTANNIDYVDDLYVEDDAEIDGGLWVNSVTTTDVLIVGGRATITKGVVLDSTAPAADATTTITFGSYSTIDKAGLCLKFFTGGVTLWCYLQTDTTSASNTALWCSTTSCE